MIICIMRSGHVKYWTQRNFRDIVQIFLKLVRDSLQMAGGRVSQV